MTLKEAIKILNKEGFIVDKIGKSRTVCDFFIENEAPDICEAMQVVSTAGYDIYMEANRFDARKARLKKEHEENTKDTGSGGEKPKEKVRIICCSASPKADFYYKHVLKEGNPAIKESASQFNDALLDEQAKKIDDQAKEIDEQNREITRLLSLVEKKENSISRLHYEKSVLEKENEDLKKGEIPARYFDKALVDEQAEKIKKLEHEKLDILEIASSSKQTISEQADKIKRICKEITRLNKAIHKKNMKIEELRKESSRHLRGKIKVFYENVDLEKMLKDKDAVLSDVAEELRLSKIREKNLTEVGQKYMKENEELKKKLANKIVDKIDAQALKSAESDLAYKEKVIAEKDDVIADLGKDLEATKNELEEKTKLVDIIRNASKEYCDYGVAANEFIKELASLYVLANNKGIINDEMLERCKNYQTYGFPANCNRETNKEINDIARGNENKKPSLFRDNSVGAVTNQKDCSPAKDTHPTEDNHDEVELDEILECVRKALEEGHTVSIKYDEADEGGDHSGATVLCGKDFVKKFKENGWFDFFEKNYKEKAEELSKVADEAFEQLLLFGEVIIKSEK